MRLLPVSAVLAAAVGAASAQIPSGHFVISSINWTAAGGGGLAIVHPTGAVPPVIVSGLGSDLTGLGSSITTGANCVAYSEADGVLIVGEAAPHGDSVDLHQLIIVAGVAAVDQIVHVGTGSLVLSNIPAITQVSMLSNANAVFSYVALDATGPLTGDGIGLLNRSTQTVSAIPITLPSGEINALVVDEPNGLIYFGMFGSGTVWSVPLAGGTPTLVSQLSNLLWNLALDEDNNLLVSNGGFLRRVDVQSGQTTQVYATGFALGVAVEQSTADPIAFVRSSPGMASNVVRLTPGGPTTVAPSVLMLATGIAVVQSASEYGTATPGATDYAFRVFPGVGGLPVAGNLSYALQVDAANGNSNLGVLAASFGSGSFPLLGIQLLVNPTSAVALGAFAAGTPIPFSLPAGLPATSVFLQSIHLDAGNPSGLAATRGLQLTTIE